MVLLQNLDNLFLGKSSSSAVSSRLGNKPAGLQELPEVDRAALLMRVFEDMSYDEIARALGISLPAVKMKIHRSRLKLSQLEKIK